MAKPRKHYGEEHEGGRVRRSCGKLRYRTRAIAEEAKRSQARQLGEGLRVYGCPECGGFHLSSHLTKRVRPTPTSESHGLSCTCRWTRGHRMPRSSERLATGIWGYP